MTKENEDIKKEEVKEAAVTTETKETVTEAVKTEAVVVKEATVASAAPVAQDKAPSYGDKKQAARGGRGQRPGRFEKKHDPADGPEMIEKVISIKRITKVTKGGKKLSFSALVVVGDGKNRVGYSLSKAAEVAIAIRKAMSVAKKNMIEVPLKGTTITHEVIGQCSGSRVLLKPASEGTGVIASGPVRAVCDGAGIHNILTKCHRSNNPINVVKATIEGLSRLKRVEQN
ncbi:MAG: small subunit ribosomal protein S5 [Lysobacterales bacterium]|jgi:small subunit ribosomal protein S5